MSNSLTQQQEFINNNLGYAQSVSAQTGLPVDFVLGQAALESGWGTSNLATNSNNLFGITNPGGTSSGFASYASPADSFAAYGSLMSSPTYATAASSSTDPYTLASNIAAAGYTPDPGYASGVAGTTQTVDSLLPGASSASSASAQSNDPFGLADISSLLPSIPGLGSLTGGSTGAGSSTGSWEAWADEVADRATGIILGLVLVGVGFFLAGRLGGLGASQLTPASAATGFRRAARLVR